MELQSQKKAELTDTHVPAFIESGAALGFAPVHRFFTMSVGSTVTDPKERNECLSHTLVQKQDRIYTLTHFKKHSGVVRKEEKMLGVVWIYLFLSSRVQGVP